MMNRSFSRKSFSHRSSSRSGLVTLAVVAALAIAGCSSGASSGAGSTAVGSTDSTIAADASTTVAATAPSTVAPTTVLAPTTTVALTPLELRSDGLGPFDFASTPGLVIDALIARLGPPATNDVLMYEDDSTLGSGYYRSLDGPYYFALSYPVGQTACWPSDFCVEFGGANVAALSFIGWSYSGPAAMMASSSNLTIGAKWSDFPSMVVFPTCYTDGGGTHHDINLIVESPGWEWLISDGGGGYVPNLPDPATTRVTFMSAGEQPFQPEGDC